MLRRRELSLCFDRVEIKSIENVSNRGAQGPLVLVSRMRGYFDCGDGFRSVQAQMVVVMTKTTIAVDGTTDDRAQTSPFRSDKE